MPLAASTPAASAATYLWWKRGKALDFSKDHDNATSSAWLHTVFGSEAAVVGNHNSL